MEVLWGGVVSYERGTPVLHQRLVLFTGRSHVREGLLSRYLSRFSSVELADALRGRHEKAFEGSFRFGEYNGFLLTC